MNVITLSIIISAHLVRRQGTEIIKADGLKADDMWQRRKSSNLSDGVSCSLIRDVSDNACWDTDAD